MSEPANGNRVSTDEATAALARSVLWQAVALGFEAPGPAQAARFGGDGAEALREAAALVGPAVAAALDRLLAAPRARPERHVHLFGHTSRGRVPPYQTEWGEESLFRKPHELADLGGFLCAFGLVISPGQHERVDHIRIQAELMAFLAAREARALDRGDAREREAAEVAGRAQRLLLAEHLGRFAPALGLSLAREDPGGFHGRLGELLHGLVTAECARVAVSPGSDSLRLRTTEVDDQELACGSGNDLVQIQRAQARGTGGAP